MPSLSQFPSQPAIRRSLRYSLGEAALWSLMVGFTEIYFSAFALLLGAKDITLGILVTLPTLLGSFSLLLAPSAVRFFHSRKKVVLAAALGQSLTIFLIPLIVPLQSSRLLLLFLLSSLYWVFGNLLLPAWQSWMGQMVDKSVRGKYFGRRHQVIQLSTFLALVVGGLILHYFDRERHLPYTGFTILFLLGGLVRIGSFFLLRAQTDLAEGDFPKSKTPLFRSWFQGIFQDHYRIFVIYVALFSLSVNLAAPYFIPYLLQSLQFSYLQFMAILAFLFAIKFLSLPAWGRFLDRYGTRKLLIFAGFLFCLPPFLWLPSQNFSYLMVIQIVVGLATSGFDLCSFNYLLDSSETHNRTQLASYYELWMGLGMTVGSILGGVLLKYLPGGRDAFLLLFFLSGLLRLLISGFFLPKIARSSAPKP